jgi:membrane protease YdiL (CAAX protease family)
MMRRRPTAFDVILCIVLFAVAMLALRWVLHATLPGGLRWADNVFGQEAVTGTMIALFCAGAYFAWWPLFRAWLAKRRGASVRKDQ